MKVNLILTKEKRKKKINNSNKDLLNSIPTGLCYISTVNVMHRISILFCLLIGLQFCAIAQNTDTHYIDVKELSPQYTESDTIHLSLTNKVDEMLYVAISIEQKCEYGWQQVIKDIFGKEDETLHRATNTKLLFSQEEKMIEVPVQKLKNYLFEPNAIYRFCIAVRNTPFEIKEKVYSSDFSLE